MVFDGDSTTTFNPKTIIIIIDFSSLPCRGIVFLFLQNHTLNSDNTAGIFLLNVAKPATVLKVD